ncbi:MAG: phosphosulfolactate synthase [Desulfotomaculaceae bacterium]|nr:phosphosulfolactate synthase [Desulfotomaculaceae bacterium]MDD4766393.1 phosphosulfolactate synthase [Desulfotomaculaceae bacterium]
MSKDTSSNLWLDVITIPLGGRLKKPRDHGLTMIIDKGLGLNETKDLFSVSGDYIDFLKLGFGTSALYNQGLLEEKINLAKRFGIEVYPGGTFLEIAIMQNKLKEFIKMAGAIGYTTLEVSDGTINFSQEVRERAISMALDAGFKVLTEVGKKNLQDKEKIGHYLKQIKRDLDCGAYRVIIEGRESGKSAGFYDQQGRFIEDEWEQILIAAGDQRLLIWEAPLKQQQQDLISRFGPNVNLGNIATNEALALEALRVGLRGDTLRPVYLRESN